MTNKQGYTKIELLIIIVLLGIVAFITINRTSYAFSVDNTTAIKELTDLIELQATEYGLEHQELFDDTTVTYITVNDLIEEGYLPSDENNQVLNPTNNKESLNENKIKLEYNTKKEKVVATFIK